MRHGKLNLENLFVTENFTAKLTGLAVSVDVFEFGKILLNIITGGKKTWDNDPNSLEDILKTLDCEDEEVKDLLRKVLKDKDTYVGKKGS